MTIVETDTAEPAQAQEARLKPKVGRIPLNLRPHDESEDDQQDGTVWAGDTRKGDSQFMFFLVALFVVVNVTLVFLLNYKSKSTPATATETAAPATAANPAMAEASAPAPAPVLEKAAELPPAPPPAAQLTSPAPPAPVVNTAAPTVPLEKSYITPANADTNKTIAAPYHPVSVNEHPPAQHIPSPSNAPQLKVIQSQNLDPAALPGIAPAAGTPATRNLPQPPAQTKASAPENATQDLLSVISQD